VLAGDFFYARSSSMIVEDGNPDVLWIFANAIRAMSEGELLQLERSYDPSVTEAHYFAVIENKSAVLLSAACEVGSILAGVTRAERRRLAEFGRELGLAFQLRDDALDYASGEGSLGKRRYADLCEGKVTLPLLLTLKRCTPDERERIAALLKGAAQRVESGRLAAGAGREGAPDLDLDPVLELVDRYRGVADTTRRAARHVARAAAAIAPFPDCRAKEDLLAAVDYAAVRDR
jgi:octaprenyl-diphosphate synthase